MQGATCRKIGEEPVGGRVAVKWEIVVTHQGKTMTATQWIDKERARLTKAIEEAEQQQK